MFSWWFKPCPVSWARLVSRPAVLMAGPPRPGVISQKSSRFSRPESACQRLPAASLDASCTRETEASTVISEPQRGAWWPVVPPLLPKRPTAHSLPGPRPPVCLDGKAVLASANGSVHPLSCGSVSRLSIVSTLGPESLPGSVGGFSGPSSSMAAELCVSGFPPWRQGAQYPCSMIT